MEAPSPTVPHANLMGQLRCMIEKHGRKTLSGYKKRFWVVNFQTKRLEVYKNDQSHEPANVYRAEDIRGVIYTGDKQNKFYAMIVQTRLKQNVKFRMSSLEEREKWSRAITQLIDAFSTSHRRNNIFEFLQRRTRVVGRSLSVNIAVDWPRLLTAPQEVLEYTVEAVDSALTNVAALVNSYGTEIAVPRSYTLNLQTLNGARLSAEDFPGPQYDPVKRSAVLNVVLYKDALGHVKFYVTDPEELINIMQSNVFRNPLIEGWIDTSPGCAETCEEIRALLRITDRPFPITFQWGQHLSDAGRVERYLQEFVNEGFFRGVLGAVRETLRSIEHMIEDLLQASVSGSSTPALTPRGSQVNVSEFAVATSGGGGNGVPALSLRMAPAGASTHAHSFSTTLFLSREASMRVGMVDRDELSNTPRGNDTASASAAAAVAEMQATAVRLLSDNITGLAITLEKRTVEEGRVPPLVVVEHTVEYGTRSRPAFLLAAKYRQIYEQPSDPKVSLHDQLFEVAFHALLSKQVSSLRSRLNAIFLGKVKVAIMWDRLLQVCHRLGAPLYPRDLPKLVNALADLYLPRMLRMVQLLSSTRAGVVQDSLPGSPASPHLQQLQQQHQQATGRRSGAASMPSALEAADPIGATAFANSVDCAGNGSSAGGSALPTTHSASFFSGGGPVGGVAAGVAATGSSAALLEDSELTLFDVFAQCVAGISIDFLSYPDAISTHGGNPHQPTAAVASAAIPDPTLVDGLLVDTILCADESTAAAMVAAVNQQKGGASRQSPMLIRGVRAYAATPRIGAWCEHYFDMPGHVAQSGAPPRHVVADEFASDSDVGTAEAPVDLENGEAVANERRAEISVLNMKRVVNAIYDSQGELVDLKIGAREIQLAIHSFQRAFKGKRVTKHDLIRVLTTNLRRLRNMFSHATGGEVNLLLTEAQAVRVLRGFCEYEETEALVEPGLRSHRGHSRRARAGSRLWAAMNRSRSQRPLTNDSNETCGEAGVSVTTAVGGEDAAASKQRQPLQERHEPTASLRGSLSNAFSVSPSEDAERVSATTASISDGNDHQNGLTSSSTLGPCTRRHTVPPGELSFSTRESAAAFSPTTSGAVFGGGAVSLTTVPSSPSAPLSSICGGGGGNSSARTRGHLPGLAAAGPTADANGDHETDAPLSMARRSRGKGGGNAEEDVSANSGNSTMDRGDTSMLVSVSTAGPPTAGSGFDIGGGGGGGGGGHSHGDGGSHILLHADNAASTLSRIGHASGAEPFSDTENAVDCDDLVDFQMFSAVALNDLLPREAVIARRGWRTGFVFGLESAGKSHIVNCMCCLPRPTVPTVGLSRQVVAFDEFVLSLNELGGRECFRKHWTFYAKRMDEVFFLLHVVDCSRQSTYAESIKYLREVAEHFRSIPLMVVFNNYQVSPYPKTLASLSYEYELDKIQKINKKRRLFTCTHELCVVHPNPKPTPMQPELYETVRRLADVLYAATPDDEKPTRPKGIDDEIGASANDGIADRVRGRLMPGRTEESWRDNSSIMFDYGSPGVLRLPLDTAAGGGPTRSPLASTTAATRSHSERADTRGNVHNPY